MHRSVLICLVYQVWSALSLLEGDSCTVAGGQNGRCKHIERCQNALQALDRGERPEICGFHGDEPIVCCDERVLRPSKFAPATKRTMTSSTTTEYTPTEAIYDELDEPQSCRPIHNITIKSTDRIAWKKCLQYQEQLVHPCVTGPAGDLVRVNNCKHSANKLITGGVNAGEAEFPHMVMLSYNKDDEPFEAGCGGTLISDWFILTAAHCTYKRNVGPVQYVATSALKQSNIAKSNIYKVAQSVQYDRYDPKLHYYDIALVKTQTRITLNTFTVPACLDLGDDLNDSQALATGWGSLVDGGPVADHLQKVVLQKFPNQDCSKHFIHDRRLTDNINPDIQMCYGDNKESKDACAGDSGGPLQLKMQRINCMYSVIGVTSFGRRCGTIGRPGVYTKVLPFVSWVEKKVWPNE